LNNLLFLFLSLHRNYGISEVVQPPLNIDLLHEINLQQVEQLVEN